MGSSAAISPSSLQDRQRDPAPAILPRTALRHGEALQVMTALGFRGDASERTFNDYVKSLRRFGIPFAPGEVGPGRRRVARYSYFHLMELALALTLRVYYFLPDALVKEIIHNRRQLCRIYEIAYFQSDSGYGAPTTINGTGHRRLRARGVYVDLHIVYAGGDLVSFGPPEVLSPFDAIARFAASEGAARAFLPINLSRLANRIVELSVPTSGINHRRRTARGREKH